MEGGWLVASCQLLLGPGELGKDTVVKDPRCQGGSQPWLGDEYLEVSSGCREVQALSCMAKAWAV